VFYLVESWHKKAFKEFEEEEEEGKMVKIGVHLLKL